MSWSSKIFSKPPPVTNPWSLAITSLKPTNRPDDCMGLNNAFKKPSHAACADRRQPSHPIDDEPPPRRCCPQPYGLRVEPSERMGSYEVCAPQTACVPPVKLREFSCRGNWPNERVRARVADERRSFCRLPTGILEPDHSRVRRGLPGRLPVPACVSTNCRIF